MSEVKKIVEGQGIWKDGMGQVSWGTISSCENCGSTCAVNTVTVRGDTLQTLKAKLEKARRKVTVLDHIPGEYDFDEDGNEICSACC